MRFFPVLSLIALHLGSCGHEDRTAPGAPRERASRGPRAPKYDGSTRDEPTSIPREAVVSSNLKSVGYDEDSSTLEVEFQSGSVYRYAEIPSSEYRALMSAASKGRYFNAHIKNGGYSYRRVR